MKKLLFLTKFIFLMIWTSLACAYELTILHLNDHHSHLSADTSMDLKLAGKMTRVQSGGFPAVVQKFKKHLLLDSGHTPKVRSHTYELSCRFNKIMNKV